MAQRLMAMAAMMPAYLDGRSLSPAARPAVALQIAGSRMGRPPPTPAADDDGRRRDCEPVFHSHGCLHCLLAHFAARELAIAAAIAGR